MNHEKLFEKLINNQINRAEFERLLELVDDEKLRARYDEYLYSEFLKEVNEQAEFHVENLSEARISSKSTKVDSKRYYSVAAALLIIVSFSFYLSLVKTIGEKDSVSQTQVANENHIEIRNTPTKRMFRTRLSDGSFVHLNAVSSISYPKMFDQSLRKVKVSGEAYFAVNHEENRPFIINAKGFEVKVLGTSFNIKAYEDEEDFSILVESGKVEITLDHNQEESFTITKNQKLTYTAEKKQVAIEEVDAGLELSWRKGILRFDSTPLEEVKKMLERWYGVEVVIEDQSLYSKSLSGIHQNENIKSVLESLTFAIGATYEIIDNVIIIKT